jgi:hypothetical protein
VAGAWEPYPDTVLHFENGLRADLRLVPPHALARQLADLGLAGPFAVITACNPLGTRLDEAGNRRLAALLAGVVRERYPDARPAEGRSPDGRHREPGWALAIPLAEATRLAADFFQNALFWYDGERFSIVPVLAPGQRLALPAKAPAS